MEINEFDTMFVERICSALPDNYKVPFKMKILYKDGGRPSTNSRLLYETSI